MLSIVSFLFAMWFANSSAEPATMEIQVEGLRSNHGLVHVCATRSRNHFPDCRGDPTSYRQTVPASQRHLRLTGLKPGRYAISLFHDQNSNARLDTFLGVPREGFGFSRNPVIRFGAPKFDSVDIELAPGFTRTAIHMQYLL
jgi:uncharacterized protein (DUF2141 family)